MKCWKCDASLPDPEWGKLSFRAECEVCSAALHACINCTFYHPGKPNDCDVPGTDFIADRTKNNFCENFRRKPEKTHKPGPTAAEIEKKLFGSAMTDAPPSPPKSRFDALFKDE